MKEFTDATAQEAIDAKGIVVIDFFADWCGPCKMVGPIIESLSEKYSGKVTVGKINVDENNALATTYGVRGIPTVIFLKDGEVVDKIVGASKLSNYEQKIETLINP